MALDFVCQNCIPQSCAHDIFTSTRNLGHLVLLVHVHHFGMDHDVKKTVCLPSLLSFPPVTRPDFVIDTWLYTDPSVIEIFFPNVRKLIHDSSIPVG